MTCCCDPETLRHRIEEVSAVLHGLRVHNLRPSVEVSAALYNELKKIAQPNAVEHVMLLSMPPQLKICIRGADVRVSEEWEPEPLRLQIVDDSTGAIFGLWIWE